MDVVYSGQTPAEAEANFLVRACQLDTYGVDPHPVKVTTLLKNVIIFSIISRYTHTCRFHGNISS